jgi:hypothetical protein
MAFQSKQDIARRKAKEDEGAALWGVRAPHPSADVADRWVKWRGLDRRIEQCRREGEANPKYAAENKKIIPALIARRDRLKVPKPYKSWAHIGWFMEQ